MNKFKVPIKNVLYMYSYVWEKVDNKDLIEIDSLDDFSSVNIYSELFLLNIKKILKRGLYKLYVEEVEEIRGIKGKINFKESINKLSFTNAKAVCNYDELKINNIYNQIIKTTALKLYRSNDINSYTKKKLNEVLLYLSQVDEIYIYTNTFDKLSFNRNNLYYYYILKICELINNSAMLNEKEGKYKFINLFDDEKNMHNIFELFVNKFYKQELKKPYKVYFQKKLNWDIGYGNKNLLPIMRLDTTIESPEETIILDTKYYKEYYSISEFGTKKFKSEHLYQLFSYMNNYNCNNNLRGILLYPMPFTEEQVKESYEVKVVSDNKSIPAVVELITIDLSRDWQNIKKDLLDIIGV